MTKKIISKELFIFFLSTILFSWILWIPSLLNSNGFTVPEILLIIGMLGPFGPTILGIILTFTFRGNNEGKLLLKKAINFKFSIKWLIITLLIFPILAAITYLIIIQMGFTVDPFYLNNPSHIPLLFLQILVIGGAIGEELGWRGFALGRLQFIFTPFWASLILGLIWSIWHLPLFFIDGTTQSYIPIWQFIIQNTLLAFYYTWIYNKTNGNLFLMILLHAMSNTSAAVFTYWYTDAGRFIGFGIMFIIALIYYIIIKIKENKKIPTNINH